MTFQPLIDKNHNKTGGEIHQEGRHADGKRIEYNLAPQTENAPVEMQQFVLITK